MAVIAASTCESKMQIRIPLLFSCCAFLYPSGSLNLQLKWSSRIVLLRYILTASFQHPRDTAALDFDFDFDFDFEF